MAGPTGGKNFSWAALNPFNKADLQRLEPAPAPRIKQEPDPNNPNPDKKTLNKEGGGDDPMFQFDSLWQPNVDKDGKPIQNRKRNSNDPYLPQLDSKKFDEMVGGMDFTRGLSPEDLEAFKAGGDGAVNALSNMLNTVARNSFRSAFAAAGKHAEHGFNSANARFREEIPDYVRSTVTDSELSGNPIYSDPAFTPIVAGVKRQFLDKFPKATPKQVNEALNRYFAHLGTKLNKKEERPEDILSEDELNNKKLRAGAPDADFLEWLGDEALLPPNQFQDNQE